MDAKQLMQIIETRMKSNDSNPTRKSLLFEIYNALQRLDEYESQDEKFKDDKSQQE